MNKEREAFNTALKTLQQRCEYLQRRLDSVEEENSKLKQEKSVEANNKLNKTSVDSLEKQVVLLNQQKLQMSHQIQILTKENQTLWSQLSKLLPGFENQGEKLSLSTLKQPQDIRTSNPNSLNLSNSMIDDYNKESLEEISLKLINGILMGKTQLENQYSEMIDLQNETASVDDKSTSYLPPQFDSESKLNKMNVYIQKLKDFKQALYKQKNELSNVIISLKNQKSTTVRKVSINSSKMLSPESVQFDSSNNSNQVQTDPLPYDNMNKDEEYDTLKICPMCGENYNGKFTDFYDHVTSHFQDDNEEFVDASATFEVVP